MKMHKLWIVPLTLAFGAAISGCSSTPKTVEVDVEKPQYKILEAAGGGREAVRETWHDEPNAWATQMGKDKGYDTNLNDYYSGQAQGASQRDACEDAQANLLDDISKKVSSAADTASARAKSNSASNSSTGITGSNESSQEGSSMSSQHFKVDLSGATMKKTYWEKRDYSEHGGARSIYYCWVLGEVSKQEISRAIALRAQNGKLREQADAKLKSLTSDSNSDSNKDKQQQ